MLKDKVYVNNPHTAEELRENIQRVISCISQEELRRVFQNVLTRYEACVQAQGSHFEHLL
jgi:DNA polymerase II large subunit